MRCLCMNWPAKSMSSLLGIQRDLCGTTWVHYLKFDRYIESIDCKDSKDGRAKTFDFNRQNVGCPCDSVGM